MTMGRGDGRPFFTSTSDHTVERCFFMMLVSEWVFTNNREARLDVVAAFNIYFPSPGDLSMWVPESTNRLFGNVI